MSKIVLESDTGAKFSINPEPGISTNKDIIPAHINGDSSQQFKVADAVNGDEALSKGQLLNEIKAVDGAGSGIDADKLAGRSLAQLAYFDNMKISFTGGGTITYNSSYYLKWSNRFISIAVGKGSTTSTHGSVDIFMPPVGTVIHGVGITPDITVTADGIKLDAWNSLWYEPVIGGSNATQYGNFHIGYYSSMDGTVIPEHWILIADVNGDSASNGGGYTARLCNGVSIKSGTTYFPDTVWLYPTLQNGWVNFNTEYGSMRYRRINNIVTIEGLVKGGTIGYTSPVFTLPVGFRPASRILGATTTDPNVHARFDIKPTGEVLPSLGSSNYYSVWCSFVAEQ